jgi:hypothetical protein
MSDLLARKIAEVARRTPERLLRRGTCTAAKQVTVHDGTVLTVSMWAVAAPATGQQVLLLNTGAGLIGIGLV